jgi:hypothetical protein
MIIARDVKIVPRAAGEWDNTSSAITLFCTCCIQHFFYDRTKKRKKTTINNSSVLCVVCEKCNKHSLFVRS